MMDVAEEIKLAQGIYRLVGAHPKTAVNHCFFDVFGLKRTKYPVKY